MKDDIKGAPKPVWVTTDEGGDYIPWNEWTLDWDNSGSRWDKVGAEYRFHIHSVGFDNGWVFDNCGGWRTWDPTVYTPLCAEDRALYNKYEPAFYSSGISLKQIMDDLRKRGLRVTKA